MTPSPRSTLVPLLVVMAAVGAWLAPAWAQTPAAAAASGERRSGGPGADDVLPALLTEVRGLRAAMEQMASGSTQAQLLVGRLQLQEGRVSSMIRRLDTVHDNLATARREYDQLRGAVQMLDKNDSPNEPQEKEEGVVAGLKTQVAASRANVDRLSAEEVQLTADIATEQQRWVAINQRLDDLERTLAKR
jgi:hypothetical protein